MTKELKRISFDEFSTNLAAIFERIMHSGESVVVEKDGEALVVARPLPPAKTRRRRARTKADYEAFLASAGSWHDVDTDKLVRDIYESRRLSTRPPVEL